LAWELTAAAHFVTFGFFLTMKKVLVAGEINPDLILQGYHSFPEPGKEVLVDDFVMALGSASAICAMGLARLGRPVGFVGKVGVDPWGDYCLQTMAAAGIDVSRVERNGALKTGVTVSISSPRDRALVSFVGAMAALRGEDLPDRLLADFHHLHVSSYFLQEGLRPALPGVLARARRAGLTTSVDPGFDPRERWGPDVLEALREVDVFLPNEVELAALGGVADPGEALRRLDNGRTRIVAKLGPRGCMTLDDARTLSAPAFPVAPVDTTGAGDSFNAGFLHAWLDGRPLPECLRWGAACGSLSTRGVGGTARQADAAEVEALLRAAS
ncbi:MAG TPA: carbohydrate kinase family protein, partial [Vicinamibacteria bacterium]|nr:carbohydrate kinase family protein [Vicinamibacteria bacterium]